MATTQPSVLEIVVHDLALKPSLIGLCAGYEGGRWRAKELATQLMDSLPEFALNNAEFQSINGANAAVMLRQAARRVYESKKFENRGEFGELLLHVLLRQCFDTIPAISKIYFKDSSNDTVKGFDAVHIVAEPGGGLELWLGEVKFYADLASAIRDVIKELEAHTAAHYLRREFVAIQNKLDPVWSQTPKLKDLLHERTSLDTIFRRLCIPVLLTYDSTVTSKHVAFLDDYKKALTAELRAAHQKFSEGPLPKDLKLHLFLVPLATKQALLTELDSLLKWQQQSA